MDGSNPAANPLAGFLVMTFAVAGLFSLLLSWFVSWHYRHSMVQLMRGTQAPSEAVAPEPSHSTTTGRKRSPVEVGSAPRMHQARHRLVVRLCAASLLMSACTALLILLTNDTLGSPSLRQWFGIALMQSWPVLLAFGLLWRWSAGRILGCLCLWMLGVALTILLMSTPDQSLAGLLGVLAFNALLPASWILALCAGSTTRAVAPWCLLPVGLLALASMLSFQLVGEWLIVHEEPLMRVLAESFNARGFMAAMLLIPWLLLGWPMILLAKKLAQAHEDRQFSDLMALFAILWALGLASSAMQQMASGAPWWSSLGYALPLLLIIPFMRFTRGWIPRPPLDRLPPTLLVLRVFHRDAQMEQLFDGLIERWRLIGPVLMIAGTDLIRRTLQPTDLMAYLSGKLAQRVVHTPAQLSRRMANLNLLADDDGRWRVNDLICTDQSWTQALAGLLDHSDRVLMDLRGFQPHNHGCIHELRALARSTHLQCVVVLIDQGTNLSIAQQSAVLNTATAPHFIWLDVRSDDRQRIHTRALDALLLTSTPVVPEVASQHNPKVSA